MCSDLCTRSFNFNLKIWTFYSAALNNKILCFTSCNKYAEWANMCHVSRNTIRMFITLSETPGWYLLWNTVHRLQGERKCTLNSWQVLAFYSMTAAIGRDTRNVTPSTTQPVTWIASSKPYTKNSEQQISDLT